MGYNWLQLVGLLASSLSGGFALILGNFEAYKVCCKRGNRDSQPKNRVTSGEPVGCPVPVLSSQRPKLGRPVSWVSNPGQGQVQFCASGPALLLDVVTSRSGLRSESSCRASEEVGYSGRPCWPWWGRGAPHKRLNET